MTLELQALVWDRWRHLVGLNLVMESQPSLLITGSLTTIHVERIDLLLFI